MPPPAAVKDPDPPPIMPPELLLALLCEQYQTLPDVGAMLDQDYRRIFLMNNLLSIYRAVRKWHTAGGQNIHSLTDQDRRILKQLMDMGIMFNG